MSDTEAVFVAAETMDFWIGRVELLLGGIQREAKWFAGELAEARESCDDKTFDSMIVRPKEADRHQHNLVAVCQNLDGLLQALKRNRSNNTAIADKEEAR